MAGPGRDEAIDILEDGDARLRDLLDGLSPEQLTAAATIGGGDWSAKDLVGHIAFWEELALEALAACRSGREPEPAGGVDEVNAVNQVRKRDWPLERILRESRETHERLIREMRTLGEDEWTTPASKTFARPERLGERLGGLTGSQEGGFRHAFAHLGDLRAYVGSLR
jgi:uncharacterized protein (TIGR03083 family)